jgi:lysophospholipase L1-like esterase
MSGLNPRITSFVAIGDSFTEGMNDLGPDGTLLGWADRLAEMLAAADEDLRYANLSVRGKLLRQIAAEQVPVAVSMVEKAGTSQALVSIAGGGNDLLRPGGDPDALASQFDAAVAVLRATGCRVLMFTGFDPLAFRLMALLRGKVAAYNMHLRAIADHRGCDLVDLWGMRSLTMPSAWSSDRLHLNSQSHRLVAERAAAVLGVASVARDADIRDVDDGGTGGGGTAAGSPPPIVWTPGVPQITVVGRAGWLAARRGDYQWARESFVPWISRRLRGTSSGDGRCAKRPELLPVLPPSAGLGQSRD